MRTSHRRIAGILVTTVMALSVVACSSDDDSSEEGSDTTDASGTEVSGTLIGAGASSQEAAMNGWQAGFQEINPEVTVEYDPVGSGGGRDQFIAGGTDFAGSDSLLDDEEYEASIERCEGDEGAIQLPHYISPVAVAFNLPGIETLNMSPDVIAGIFAEEITNWNDSAIADENPDVDLPDLAINPVHRSDESGTSENFTDYLATVSSDIWTYGEVTPPAKFIHDEEGRRGSAVSSMVSGGCIVSGSNVSESLLFTGVHCHSYSQLERVVALPYTVINRNARLSNVVLDRGVIVPEGLVVGEDPEEDARHFRVSKGGVTLITQPMIDALMNA